MGGQPQTLFEYLERRVKESPNLPFATQLSSGVVVGYDQVRTTARRAATWLRTQGIEPRDRVVVATGTSWKFFSLMAACSYVGARMVLLDPQTGKRELAAIK